MPEPHEVPIKGALGETIGWGRVTTSADKRTLVVVGKITDPEYAKIISGGDTFSIGSREEVAYVQNPEGNPRLDQLIEASQRAGSAKHHARKAAALADNANFPTVVKELQEAMAALDRVAEEAEVCFNVGDINETGESPTNRKEEDTK